MLFGKTHFCNHDPWKPTQSTELSSAQFSANISKYIGYLLDRQTDTTSGQGLMRPLLKSSSCILISPGFPITQVHPWTFLKFQLFCKVRLTPTTWIVSQLNKAICIKCSKWHTIAQLTFLCNPATTCGWMTQGWALPHQSLINKMSQQT